MFDGAVDRMFDRRNARWNVRWNGPFDGHRRQDERVAVRRHSAASARPTDQRSRRVGIAEAARLAERAEPLVGAQPVDRIGQASPRRASKLASGAGR